MIVLKSQLHVCYFFRLTKKVLKHAIKQRTEKREQQTRQVEESCMRFLTFVFEFLISLICNIIRFPGGFCVWHPNMAETGASCRLIISHFFVYVRKQFLFNSSYTIYELIFDVLSKA